MSKNEPIKVMVSILCKRMDRHFWIQPELHMAVVMMTQKPGFQISMFPAMDKMSAEAARNHATDEFLDNSDSEYLLMLDNDIRPIQQRYFRKDNKDAYVDLLEMVRLAHSKHIQLMVAPVWTITGTPGTMHLNIYPEREPKTPNQFRSINKEELSEMEKMPDQLRSFYVAGSGVMLVSRSLFGSVRHWYRTRDNSEDFVFCMNARRLGFETYASLMYTCGHAITMDVADIPYFKGVVSKDVEKK